MYRIVTNMGLDETFEDPTGVCDLLLPHLVEQCPHGRVEWAIETGDVPIWGSINTHGLPVVMDQVRDDVHDIATSLLWIHHREAWQTAPTRIDT